MFPSNSVFSSLNSGPKFTTKQRLCQVVGMVEPLQFFPPKVIFFQSLFKFIYLMYMSVFAYMGVCAPHAYLCLQVQKKKCIRSSATGVMGGGEPTFEFWD